ncbi:hypothetical protein [Wenzhouxiangella marina]|nr:hypothetical protein [Wenzhouxiangella marina]MBB6086250.1 hypothetical protein [Wenzhouxiangella marina]
MHGILFFVGRSASIIRGLETMRFARSASLIGLVLLCSGCDQFGPAVSLHQDRQQTIEQLQTISELQYALRAFPMASREIPNGNADAIQELLAIQSSVRALLQSLQDGGIGENPHRGFSYFATFEEIQWNWEQTDARITALLEQSSTMLNLHEEKVRLHEAIPQIQMRLDQTAMQLISSQAPAVQVHFTNRLMTLTERWIRKSEAILAGPFTGRAMVASATGELDYFKHIQTALLNGSETLGLGAIEDSQAREILLQASRDIDAAEHALRSLIEQSEAIVEINSLADTIWLDVEDLAQDCLTLSREIASASQTGSARGE